VGGEFLDYPGDEKGSPEEVINCHCIAVALPPEQTGIGLSVARFNENHEPAGSDVGGQFASEDSGVSGIESSDESSGINDALNEKQAAPVAEFENKRKASGYERLLLVDSDGKTISETKGTKSRVVVTDEQIKAMKDDGNAVSTHNHPYGASFSTDDWLISQKANVAEQRVVTRHGTFVARRPSNGWPSEDVMKSVAKSAGNSSKTALMIKVRRGDFGKDYDAANRWGQHDISKRIAEKIGSELKYAKH
jgi:hypothetical protein